MAEGVAFMDWRVFIGITLILFGFASLMTGQALAATWRPIGWTVFYILLLGFVDRFIVWSLFGGDLGSVAGYLVDTGTLLAIGLVSYRVTQVRKMVSQYPWPINPPVLFSGGASRCKRIEG